MFYDVDWTRVGKMSARRDLVGTELSRTEQAVPQAVAFERVIAAGRFNELAAILAWRRVTVEQLGTILGLDELQPLSSRGGRRRWSELPSWVPDAWMAGFVKRSVSQDAPVMLQADGFHKVKLQSRLTPSALEALTSGTGSWNSPQGALRHDVCTSELLLRTGEHSPHAVAVLAESAANYNRLAGGEVVHRSRCGDGLISRIDGRHVVVELTCNAGKGKPEEIAKLRRKIKTSVDLLLQSPSIAVLYVEAAHPHFPASEVWTPLTQLVAEVVNALNDDDANAIDGRLGVTRWRWYWPGPHQVTAWANSLGAYFPTRYPASPWREVHYLDPRRPDFSLDTTAWGHELLECSVASSSNPYWLRYT